MNKVEHIKQYFSDKLPDHMENELDNLSLITNIAPNIFAIYNDNSLFLPHIYELDLLERKVANDIPECYKFYNLLGNIAMLYNIIHMGEMYQTRNLRPINEFKDFKFRKCILLSFHYYYKGILQLQQESINNMHSLSFSKASKWLLYGQNLLLNDVLFNNNQTNKHNFNSTKGIFNNCNKLAEIKDSPIDVNEPKNVERIKKSLIKNLSLAERILRINYDFLDKQDKSCSFYLKGISRSSNEGESIKEWYKFCKKSENY